MPIAVLAWPWHAPPQRNQRLPGVMHTPRPACMIRALIHPFIRIEGYKQR